MTIIVFSDSHGRRDEMKRIIKKHKEAETVIFCGDGNNDITDVHKHHPDKTFYCVKGNCDWCCQFPTVISVTIAGKKFVITHGHVQRVKESLMQLVYLGQHENADIVTFGHTHEQLTVLESNMILVNPGSVGYAGQYSTIEIDENTGSVTVREFPPNKHGTFVVK